MQKLLFIIVAGFILAGCTQTNNRQTTTPQSNGVSAPLDQQDATNPAVPSRMPIYTLLEVAAHSSAQDCWLVVDNRVFDVTQYVASGSHPGGATILQGCGQEATEMFNNQHTAKAKSMLPDFYIGDLVLN